LASFSKGGAAANEKVRELRKEMPDAVRDGKAGVSRIDVERTPGKIRIAIHTAKPGILIGRKGEGVKKIRACAWKPWLARRSNWISKRFPRPIPTRMLVAKNIADQLERRIAYRRAMKRAIQQAMKQGAQGIKILVGGRLGRRRNVSRCLVARRPRAFADLARKSGFRHKKHPPPMVRSVSRSGSIRAKSNLKLKKKSKRRKACTSASNRDVA
jgi:ribosomal protein S3